MIWDDVVRRGIEQREEERKQSKSKRRSKSSTDSSDPGLPSTTEIAKRIMEEDGRVFKTCTDNGQLFMFNGRVYIPDQEWVIKEQCRLISPNIETRQINEVVNYIKDTTYIDRSEFDKVPYIVTVDNGLLNIHTRELSEFTAKHLSLIKLPMPFRPEADCPNIRKFLSEVMESEEDINDLIKLIGYCLLPTCEYEMAVMLHGDGRNGKGTLLKVIEAFLGKTNISNRSLQDLDDNRFAVADLFGKVANILADLKALRLKQTGYFKMITSGDTLYGEKKFKDAFGFNNRAKLFYSANEIPETEDKTDAFYRRWRLFPMYKKFDIGQGRDTQLIKSLTTPEELSGLLNWALEQLAVLIKDGGIKQDIDKVRNEWERHTSDVSAFLYEKCTVDVRNTEYYITTEELYGHYLKFCEGRKARPKEFNAFGRKLAERDIYRHKRLIDGERLYVYEGVIIGLCRESWSNEPVE